MSSGSSVDMGSMMKKHMRCTRFTPALMGQFRRWCQTQHEAAQPHASVSIWSAKSPLS